MAVRETMIVVGEAVKLTASEAEFRSRRHLTGEIHRFPARQRVDPAVHCAKPLIFDEEFLADLCVTKQLLAKLRFNVVGATAETGPAPPQKRPETSRALQVSANLCVDRSATYRSSHTWLFLYP